MLVYHGPEISEVSFSTFTASLGCCLCSLTSLSCTQTCSEAIPRRYFPFAPPLFHFFLPRTAKMPSPKRRAARKSRDDSLQWGAAMGRRRRTNDSACSGSQCAWVGIGPGTLHWILRTQWIRFKVAQSKEIVRTAHFYGECCAKFSATDLQSHYCIETSRSHSYL